MQGGGGGLPAVCEKNSSKGFNSKINSDKKQIITEDKLTKSKPHQR